MAFRPVPLRQGQYQPFTRPFKKRGDLFVFGQVSPFGLVRLPDRNETARARPLDHLKPDYREWNWALVVRPTPLWFCSGEGWQLGRGVELGRKGKIRGDSYGSYLILREEKGRIPRYCLYIAFIQCG